MTSNRHLCEYKHDCGLKNANHRVCEKYDSPKDCPHHDLRKCVEKLEKGLQGHEHCLKEAFNEINGRAKRKKVEKLEKELVDKADRVDIEEIWDKLEKIVNKSLVNHQSQIQELRNEIRGIEERAPQKPRRGQR